ncbi:MAG: hypothetical protein AAB367_02945 [Patescibacteria group bacterium]
MGDVEASKRYRLTKPVRCGETTYERTTEVFVTQVQTNVGRTLITGRLDSGKRLALFADELEPVEDRKT